MATEAPTRHVPQLKALYNNELRDKLQQELGLRNVMMVPRIEKIVVNMGLGAALAQPKLLEGAVTDPRPSRVPDETPAGAPPRRTARPASLAARSATNPRWPGPSQCSPTQSVDRSPARKLGSRATQR